MKNRALPKLRKQQFITIRQMKLGPDKLIWVSIDWDKLQEWTTPWDTHEHLLNGGSGIGFEKAPGEEGNYPYKFHY